MEIRKNLPLLISEQKKTNTRRNLFMKKHVPFTNVSAGTIQDIINQMRGEGEKAPGSSFAPQSQEPSREAAAPAAEPAKKGIVPRTIVSVDPEILKTREILTSQKEAVIDPDGTIREIKSVPSASQTKAKTVPQTIVSAGGREAAV